MMGSFAIILLRTTAFTIVAALAAKLLVRHNRISPRIQRITAVLVLTQGWMFLPIVLNIPVETESRVARMGQGAETALQPFSAGTSPEGCQSLVPQPEMEIAMPAPATASIHWIFIAWLCGVVACVLWFVIRCGSLIHHVPLGSYPSNRQWMDEWSQVTGDLNVNEAVQFRISDHLGPLLCFVPFAYLVLCPKQLWTTLDSAQRKAILIHELAHVKRHDVWKSVGIRVLALPQWFNPLAWMIVNAFDEAAEWACDDLVLAWQKEAGVKSYPLTLVQIAEFARDRLPIAVAAGGGVLGTRVRRLIEPPIMEERMMSKALVPLILCSFVLFQSVRIEAVAKETSQDNQETAATSPTTLENVQVDESEEIKALRERLPDYLDSVRYNGDRPSAQNSIATSFGRELDSLVSKRTKSNEQGQQRDHSNPGFFLMLYNVPDLVGPPERPEFSASGRGPMKSEATYDALTELIASTIAPDSWHDTGGEGAIEAFAPNRQLVVRQSKDGHDQIAALLQTLRQLQDTEVVLRLTYLRVPATVSAKIGIRGKRLAALSSSERRYC